jgi:hypothetical protein
MSDEQNYRAFGNHAITAALLNLPVTYIWVIILAYISTAISNWVGAGHEPVPAIMYIGFLPSALCLMFGARAFTVGFDNKYRYSLVCGLLSIISGVVGCLLAYFEIIMLHIG